MLKLHHTRTSFCLHNKGIHLISESLISEKLKGSKTDALLPYERWSNTFKMTELTSKSRIEATTVKKQNIYITSLIT